VAQIARTIQPGGLGAYDAADNRSDLSEEQEEARIAVTSVEKEKRKVEMTLSCEVMERDSQPAKRMTILPTSR
jgi:hypothetical protein